MNKTTKNEGVSKAPTPEAATPSDAELLSAATRFEERYADAINARVAAGLTRAQAIQVQRDQVAADLGQ